MIYLNRALQFPAEAWLRFDLAHGSITHIIVKPVRKKIEILVKSIQIRIFYRTCQFSIISIDINSFYNQLLIKILV